MEECYFLINSEINAPPQVFLSLNEVNSLELGKKSPLHFACCQVVK